MNMLILVRGGTDFSNLPPFRRACSLPGRITKQYSNKYMKLTKHTQKQTNKLSY